LTLQGSAHIRGFGNGLDNTLIGNLGANRLEGYGGADILDGGRGNDTLIGGAGNDVYRVDSTSDVVVELANEGRDCVQTALNYWLGANVEDLQLTGTANVKGYGNDLDNTLIGNAAINRLEGHGGNDLIDGGGGKDVLVGGAGNDVYRVETIGDFVWELANEGRDRVESSVSFTLIDNIEDLTLTGAAAANATGNAGVNQLIGNSAANILNGMGGNDTLRGGGGADQFVLAKGGGDDVVQDFSFAQGDKLDLRGFGGPAGATFTQHGADAMISFAGGESLLLLGVSTTNQALSGSIIW